VGINTFVYALVLVSMSHNSHGRIDGITKEHVATYGSEDTCQLARKSWAYYDRNGSMYFCQRELLK
jgi:hypothetical protein